MEINLFLSLESLESLIEPGEMEINLFPRLE